MCTKENLLSEWKRYKRGKQWRYIKYVDSGVRKKGEEVHACEWTEKECVRGIRRGMQKGSLREIKMGPKRGKEKEGKKRLHGRK